MDVFLYLYFRWFTIFQILMFEPQSSWQTVLSLLDNPENKAMEKILWNFDGRENLNATLYMFWPHCNRTLASRFIFANLRGEFFCTHFYDKCCRPVNVMVWDCSLWFDLKLLEMFSVWLLVLCNTNFWDIKKRFAQKTLQP